jgi:predicted flap endonuclease-1-like 5' DNA nuclease
MRVVLTDGAELSCTNFKAIDSGVLLTKDKKRKKVIGFVPHDQVRYVAPDDHEVEVAERAGHAADRTLPASAEDGGFATRGVAPNGDGNVDERDLGHLDGLGSTYADRLRAAGYRNLSDLATADPITVAEAASVAPGRGRQWVHTAIQLTTSPGADDRPESETDETADGSGHASDDGPGEDTEGSDDPAADGADANED